jgi:serine/threonine protein kinase
VEKKLGHYTIVRLLGTGGMGQVYEAVHDQMKRRAAIKVLHKKYAHNRQIAARFLNERRDPNRRRTIAGTGFPGTREEDPGEGPPRIGRSTGRPGT